ncbi:MAG: hypothetical protein CJBNEKGG_03848 [Prosthecobacter sp.]|nr:hypothetical protein [Prosthecobacter sp.]
MVRPMRNPRRSFPSWMICLLAWSALAQPLKSATLEGIVFAAEPGKVFVPVEEAVEALKWSLRQDDEGKVFELNGLPMRAGSLRCLTDGTELVDKELLELAGAPASALDEKGRFRVGRLFRGFTVLVSAQRVEVNLAAQTLECWQGGRLVLKTRISSGRRGSTPKGDFRAGPYRAVMHRSSRYQNAPMPWSVQINGHVFIHGFTSVPAYPASHGCIRLPLDEGNPAKLFFEWVLNGTPVRVR